MGKKILVIDDSAAVRKSIAFTLEQKGFSVVDASDGLEGLARLQEQNPDLVITDINMPNLNGIEFIKRVRADAVHKFVPIIVLTTESQGGIMEEGKKAGATGWIVKPFDAEKLVGVVNKILG